MVQSLARWLRILGEEALYPEDFDDTALLRLAKEKQAVLLTRDLELSKRAEKSGVACFLVPRNLSLAQQLALLVREFRLDLSRFPSRTLCPSCNGSLRLVGRKEAEGKALESIVARHESFWLCGSCGKLYWEGSHWEKISAFVEQVKKLASE